MGFIDSQVYEDFKAIASADISEDEIADETKCQLEQYHAIAQHIYIIVPYLRRFRGENRAINIIIDHFGLANIKHELAFLALFTGNIYYARVAFTHIDKNCPVKGDKSARNGWVQTLFAEVFHFAGRKNARRTPTGKISEYIRPRLSDSDYYAISPILPEKIRKYVLLFTETLFDEVTGEISGNTKDDFIPRMLADIAEKLQKKMMMIAADANCDRKLSLDIIRAVHPHDSAEVIKTIYFCETAFWENDFGRELFRECCARDPDFLFRLSFDKDIGEITKVFPDIFTRDAVTAGLKKHSESSLFVWMLRANRDWFTYSGVDSHENTHTTSTNEQTKNSRDILPDFYPNAAEKLYICSSDLSPDDIAGVFEYMLRPLAIGQHDSNQHHNNRKYSQQMQKNIHMNIRMLMKDRIIKPAELPKSELIRRHQRLCAIAEKLIAICNEEFSAIYCKEFRKNYDDFCAIYNVPADIARNIRFV